MRIWNACLLLVKPYSRTDTALKSGPSVPVTCQTLTYAIAARIARSSAGCSSVSGRSSPNFKASKYEFRYSRALVLSASAVTSDSARLSRRNLCTLMRRRRLARESCVASQYEFMNDGEHHTRKEQPMSRGKPSTGTARFLRKLTYMASGPQSSMPCPPRDDNNSLPVKTTPTSLPVQRIP